MRQLSAIALAFGTLVAAPSFGAELLDSVFQVTYRYAGEDRILNDTVVPRIPGACYNWHVHLSGEAPASVTETFTLPLATDWGELATAPDDGIDISADGTMATRTFVPEVDADGWFSNGWCVVETDPLGAHRIEIAVAGESIVSYDFQVVLPEDYAWPSVNQPIPRERSVDQSW